MQDKKFKEGEIVVERIHPTKKLIVKAYSMGVYYCETPEGSRKKRKPLVFLERDLKEIS